MKRPPYRSEPDILCMNPAQQHGHLLGWYQWLYKGPPDAANGYAPYWLYLLAYAYGTGNTDMIIGTPLMTLYRTVLTNQLRHEHPTT